MMVSLPIVNVVSNKYIVMSEGTYET